MDDLSAASAVISSPGPRRRRPWLRVASRMLIVAAVIAAVGPGVGWAWAQLTPRLPVMKVNGGYIYVDAEPEQVIAAEGWFAILGLGAGLIFGLLVWLTVRRHRGVAMLVALAVGSLAGAWLAWWVGYKIGYAQFLAVSDSAAVGTRLDAPLSLRITDLDPHKLWPVIPTGVVAIQALIATFTYTLLAGFSGHPNLRSTEPRHAQPLYAEAQPAYQEWWNGDPKPVAEARPEAQPPQHATFGPARYGTDGTDQFGTVQYGTDPFRTDQFGPGRTGSSDSATGTART